MRNNLTALFFILLPIAGVVAGISLLVESDMGTWEVAAFTVVLLVLARDRITLEIQDWRDCREEHEDDEA